MCAAPNEGISARALAASASLFSGLDRGALKRLAAAAVFLRVAKGTFLFKRGDRCDGFHVLLSGQVKLALRTDDGDEKIIELVAPGSTFGEAIALSGHAYPIAAQALADSTLLHIPNAALRSEIERAPALARRIVAGLSQGLIDLMSRHEGVTLRSGTQRVVGYLLEQCGDEARREATVVLPAKKGVIASQMNLTQEHFSRILHDLARQKLIEVDGRVVRLADTAALRRCLD